MSANIISPRSTQSDGRIPRWIQILIGISLGLLTLGCTLIAVGLTFTRNEKAPILAPTFGLFMVVACGWVLTKCLRLISGRALKGGLMSPRALRVAAWVALLLPICGLLIGLITGRWTTNALLSIAQTIAYLSAFFGLRRLAAFREANNK